MNYVYVPYGDRSMDLYAEALVEQKNENNKIFGKHKLIDRAGNSEDQLSVVGWHDRLYVLAHGSSETSGVAVDMKGNSGILDQEKVQGQNYADMLIARGLRNTTVDLRLWTCWGGIGTQPNNPNWRNSDGETESLALKVARQFKTRSYLGITVVAYRDLVFIGHRELKDSGGHKQLVNDEGTVHFVASRDRVTIRAAALLP